MLGDQAHDIAIKLHQICGWKLNKAKRIPKGAPSLTREATALGLDIELLDRHGQDAKFPIALVRLDIAKRDKYVSRLDQILETQKLSATCAGKVAGQANYTQTHLWKKSARVLLWPFMTGHNHQIAVT